jgi:hypothetical protein
MAEGSFNFIALAEGPIAKVIMCDEKFKNITAGICYSLTVMRMYIEHYYASKSLKSF